MYIIKSHEHSLVQAGLRCCHREAFADEQAYQKDREQRQIFWDAGLLGQTLGQQDA